MYARVWQFDVVAGLEPDFERIYGSAGAWTLLFRRSPGTELYRDVDHSGRYVTVDRFTNLEAWRRFLEKHRSDYDDLDARCEAVTVSETDLLG